MAKPRNHGKHYSFLEIVMIYLAEETKENTEWLAEYLGRSCGAIQLVYAWIKRGHNLPKRAHNKIRKQVRMAKKLLPKQEGIVEDASSEMFFRTRV